MACDNSRAERPGPFSTRKRRTSIWLNSDRRPDYAPPCPSEGMHFFRFKVFALDAMLPSFAVPSDERITTAMSGHILAAGEMVGSWMR